MTRALKTLVSCLALVTISALVACGQRALPEVKRAPQPEVETRAAPLKQPRELPRLLAPPPAYGNKIVMARLAPRSRSN